MHWYHHMHLIGRQGHPFAYVFALWLCVSILCVGCKTDGKPSQPPWWLAGFTHVSITKMIDDVTCNQR